MAFGVTDFGNIAEDFTNSLTEALGLASPGALENKGPESAALDAKASLFGVAPAIEAARWTGNVLRAKSAWYRYGFAIVEFKDGNPDIFEAPYFLDIPPQNIQQKEIFSTHVQATRKGVIVESEGVVFKDIVIAGTTGVFPGERGGSTSPQSNLFSDPFKAPGPPAGVDSETGRSKRNGVKTLSGYEEFLRLRQFFLLYAKMKVEQKGKVFFAFLNEKDRVDVICEPMEFTMERSARNPLNYNYRIVLKAIAPVAALFKGSNNEPTDESGFFDALNSIANLSANISASISQATEIINASTNLLVSITQALDNVFLTPLRQLNIGLNALNTGLARTVSLPATLSGNALAVDKNRLAVAESIAGIGSAPAVKSTASPKVSQPTQSTAAETNESGDVVNTSTADSTETELNLLSPDGNTLKEELTEQEFSAMREIQTEIENDPVVPLPRAFVEILKKNTQAILNDLADSIGVGNDSYSEIQGRTVTQQAPALPDPSDEDFILLGALQTIIAQLNKILANNEFFQTGADNIYNDAQASYGQIATLITPNKAREVTVQPGDTLERIALREYGDALRWVDIAVLNNLKEPYIAEGEDLPKNVKKPGDKILVGQT